MSEDSINHPKHYTQGKIEVHSFILDQQLPWDAGNVVKYVCRYRFKNGVEDLLKARWYLNSLIRKERKTYECIHTKLKDGTFP